MQDLLTVGWLSGQLVARGSGTVAVAVEQRRDAAGQVTGRVTRRRWCDVNGVIWHVVGRGTGGQRCGQGRVEAAPGMGGGD